MVAESPKPSRPPRVLVVDDDERNRRLLDAVLVPQGYEVIEAAGGTRALQLVAQGGIDLVLLDVMMPDLDGVATCRLIRQELGRIDLPVIFITALTDREARIRGKQAGGDDFLAKPIDETELLVRVRNLLKVKAYHDLRDRQRETLERELEKRSEQLVRAERLASLGTLAGGVGHELNNMTTVLMSYLGFVRQKARRGQPADPGDLEALATVTRHLKMHAQHLLSLGRPGPDHAQIQDLGEIVRSTLAMLQTVGKTKSVQVQTQLPPVPVMVTVNRARIEQVIVNLVGNAVDALGAVPPRTRRVSVTVERAGSERVTVRVEDNGSGIPPENLQAIFEPYYTTKEPGKGTGLGLPVVRQIVESYGGTLTVQSTPGERTVFGFDLPMAAGSSVGVPSEGPPAPVVERAEPQPRPSSSS